jgi:cellulose synthase/poly-beta-1,6-N-acetylglucosamine synthase-like glycosyltransferase
MRISVIIAFYKNLPFLDLILAGLTRQSWAGFEVIVAEDDNAEATVEYVKKKSPILPFELKHVSQEDLGFHKNEILNKAILASEGEFLIFLDGDCIPHRHLLKEYASLAEEGIAFYGRRVMMSERLTKELLSTGDPHLLSFYNQARFGSKRLEDGIYLPFFKKRKNTGIWGCNWGIYKRHLAEVNGYDEDYISAGVGEDLDIEWRLLRNGIKLQSVKHRAIVYHLHHKAHYSMEGTAPNYAMLKAKKESDRYYCVNGLDKYRDPQSSARAAASPSITKSSDE